MDESSKLGESSGFSSEATGSKNLKDCNSRDLPSITTPVRRYKKKKLKTPSSLPTQELTASRFFQQEKEKTQAAVKMLMKNASLPPCFTYLFALFGIHKLDDFEDVDEDVLTVIETKIQSNGFIDTVDLNCPSNQIQYLGRKLAEGQLKKFKFLGMEVIRLTKNLPKALKQAQELRSAYIQQSPLANRPEIK